MKKPLGELIIGGTSDCNLALKKVQDAEKPRSLILVGDTISRNAVQFGISPDVMIIDGKETRGEAIEFVSGKSRIFRTINAPGEIDLLAWNAVEEAIEKSDCVVIVQGEEDLLTLVAIMTAPIGSIVAYGQPKEGIVLVRVSEQKKKEIQRVIDALEKAH